MARITLSPLLADMRGAVAHAVFSRTPRSLVVKRYRKPKQSPSAAQLARRAAYGRLVQIWRELPPEFRADLENFTKPYGMSGWNWIIHQNLNLELDYSSYLFSAGIATRMFPPTYYVGGIPNGYYCKWQPSFTAPSDWYWTVWHRQVPPSTDGQCFTLATRHSINFDSSRPNVIVDCPAWYEVVSCAENIVTGHITNCRYKKKYVTGT